MCFGWFKKLFMRRRISLYIGGERADLSETGFILYNYTQEEAENPTIVRNSFTQTITLQGTARNNRIFGHFWRSDRLSGDGLYKPLTRVPFVLYNEMSEILESGYVRLESVKKKGASVEYSVTLFGGLGSFFANLAMKDNGDRMTLADLKYTGEGADDSELDFVIDRHAVLSAWKSIAGQESAIEPVAMYPYSTIDEDGNLAGGLRGKCVYRFRVTGGDTIYVTGEGWNDPMGMGALASVLDADGNVLRVVGYGEDTPRTDYPVMLDDEAAEMLVAGDSNYFPPALKGFPMIWDILSFAPCYEGYPSGEFDAQKAVFLPADTGVTIPTGYDTKGGSGFALAALSQKFTGIEMKDFRSYLQRPVIKWSKVVEAMCEPYNNGGYSVELDPDFFSDSNPYYGNAYMTLPVISGLDVQSEGVEGSLPPMLYDSQSGSGRIGIPNGGQVLTEYKIRMAIRPKIVPSQPALAYHLHASVWFTSLQPANYMNIITYTLTAYDEDGNALATMSKAVSSIAPSVPNAPAIDVVGNFDENGEWVSEPVIMEVDEYGVSYITIEQTLTNFGWGAVWTGNQPSLTDVFPNTSQDFFFSADHGISDNADGCTYNYQTGETARTGAVINKRMLLSGEHTPADYLLSYCKMFGLVFMADKATKKVSILMRKNFYTGNVVDWTDRINTLEGFNVLPNVVDAKWYDFAAEYENGEWAKYYDNLYDRVFGSMRVDTGSEFATETANLLDGNAFTGLCEVLERSVEYCDIVFGNTLMPTIWQHGGKYTLYDTDGEPKDFDLPLPPSTAVRTWWNAIPTWDTIPRPQIHNADNAAFEHRDALLFLQSGVYLSGTGWAVSDDTPLMMTLNEHKPCWFIGFGAVDPSAVVTSVPRFSRYYRNNAGEIALSWDFGTPNEVQLPSAVFVENSGIYGGYWAAYMADRYNGDSRVITCKANLKGYRVGQELMRDFYYWDGAIWALNKIVNHSLTTWDDTEVELIKVQDVNNYKA